MTFQFYELLGSEHSSATRRNNTVTNVRVEGSCDESCRLRLLVLSVFTDTAMVLKEQVNTLRKAGDMEICRTDIKDSAKFRFILKLIFSKLHLSYKFLCEWPDWPRGLFTCSFRTLDTTRTSYFYEGNVRCSLWLHHPPNIFYVRTNEQSCLGYPVSFQIDLNLILNWTIPA